MKKLFERYTCATCGEVADSECLELREDTSSIPKGWRSLYAMTVAMTIDGSKCRTELADGYACSKKCAISLLTKAMGVLGDL